MEDIKHKSKSEVNLEINKIILNDKIERYILDSNEKVIYWINKKFEEQKEAGKDELIIDLSNVIINIYKHQSFWIGNLCGKVEGIIHIGDNKDLIPDERGGIIVKNEIQFQVKHKLKFNNSIIYNLQFYNTEFFEVVDFSNLAFGGGANFEKSIFFQHVYFVGTLISQYFEEDSNIIDNISGRINFQNIIFRDKVEFVCLKCTRCYDFHFSGNSFEDDVKFQLCSFNDSNNKYYDFSSNDFKGNVIIDGTQNPSNPYNILSWIAFDSSHFHQKLKILGMQIGNISIQNSHFYDTVSLTFNKYSDISKLDFSFSTIKSLFFIDSDLGDYQGESIALSSEISFYKALIMDDAFIFLRNINNTNAQPKQGVLNFEYANILGSITIQDSKLEMIKFYKSTLNGNINIEDVDCEYDCRESIIKIKNNYIKNNDMVNSLALKAKEMKFYSEHFDFGHKWITKSLHWLTSNWIGNIIGVLILPILLLISLVPIKSLNKIREYTLLFLNRISSSFGESWGQGIMFTCITAWAFFVVINLYGLSNGPLFEWGWQGWESFGIIWNKYLKILNVLNFNDKLQDFNFNAIGETLFFLSKIFVAYGIYQTISAFRKYGK